MFFFIFVCLFHLDLKQERTAPLEHLIRALVPKINAAVHHDSSEYATNVAIDADDDAGAEAGADADLNMPLVLRSTRRRTILVSVDLYSCTANH